MRSWWKRTVTSVIAGTVIRFGRPGLWLALPAQRDAAEQNQEALPPGGLRRDDRPARQEESTPPWSWQNFITAHKG